MKEITVKNLQKGHTLQDLQVDFLQILFNGNFCTDHELPSSEIHKWGYSSLEKFISDIPCHLLQSYNTKPIPEQPPIGQGQRFVVRSIPEIRGSVVEPVEKIGTHYWISLKLDKRKHRKTLFWYIFFPFSYVCNKVVSFFFHGGSKVEQFSLEEIMLEKFYYCQFLPKTNLCSECQPSSKEKTLISPRGNMTLATSTPGRIVPKRVTTDELLYIRDAHRTATSPIINVVHPNTVSPTKRESSRRGVEGGNNSCYLDSMLFCMFYATKAFDFMLADKSGDRKYARKCRSLLRTNIVNPLRETFFCSYEQVMDLRIHLSKKNPDFLGSFMDAEQVLYTLCEEVLAERHFCEYYGVDDEGWGDFMHLMCLNGTETKLVGNIQECMEMSFEFNGDLKLASVPNPALVLGMPRSNRLLIHYKGIVPNLFLDIGKVIVPATCNCGELASWELQASIRQGLETKPILLCNKCAFICTDKGIENDMKIVSRRQMMLKSIVCIHGVHFTAFTRDTDGWLYFDSMSGNGPQVTLVPEMNKTLEGLVELIDVPTLDNMDKMTRRSITDAHLCFYEPIDIAYENKLTIR